jgi:transcription elongation factor B subunit 2
MKITMFTDATESTKVSELKRIIQGLTKVEPDNQRLFAEDNRVMEDDCPLSDYGLTSTTAKAQSPASLSLAFRMENGEFETVDITPYSMPPELPDVMKSQEAPTNNSTN